MADLQRKTFWIIFNKKACSVVALPSGKISFLNKKEAEDELRKYKFRDFCEVIESSAREKKDKNKIDDFLKDQ